MDAKTYKALSALVKRDGHGGAGTATRMALIEKLRAEGLL
jgi:hypothetical protein